MTENYNKFEKLMSLFLTKFPRAKKTVKKIYQYLNYCIYKKNYSHYTSYVLKKFSLENKETFFGYYDKSPINRTGALIIFHASNISTMLLPDPHKPVDLIIFNNFKNSVVSTFTSYAYNWQQGTKCQWIDDNRLIYNDYDTLNNRYISKIVDVQNSDIIKKIDYPIYDVFGDIAISLNFDRLAKLRPDYGYRNRLKFSEVDLNDLENDGIFKIDLQKNTQSLLISLKRIIHTEHKENMVNAQHKVNHIMISPKGDKFIFLHRYFVKGRKFDRLMLSDLDGYALRVLANDDMVSHCCWFDNSTIISYMRNFRIGDKYYLIDIDKGEIKILGKNIIDTFGDGHPNIYNDLLLFDTYPNKSRMRGLYLFNLSSHKVDKLGDFFEAFRYYGETRCDLHPRWTHDGKQIFFDAVFEGKRHLYMLTLGDKNV